MALDWESTLKDASTELGGKILEAAKNSAGEAWDEIEQANKDQLENLALLLAQFKMREMMGEDVSGLIAHLESQIADLRFTNESIGQRAVIAFWKQAMEITGSIIFNVAKKAVGL